jgi:SepF-like predicted cell division protein (DUF552 family)
MFKEVAMPIKNLFSRRERDFDEIEGEDYLEVNVMDSGMGKPTGKMGIRIESLEDFSDSERILRQVREGSIIFLKIKGLKDKDMGELKRAVDKLKRSVLANNGDIIGIEQNWLILTPEFVTVHK